MSNGSPAQASRRRDFRAMLGDLKGGRTVATLDMMDVRLEYIAYLEEESDFVESRLFLEDILFSFLFAPVSR